MYNIWLRIFYCQHDTPGDMGIISRFLLSEFYADGVELVLGKHRFMTIAISSELLWNKLSTLGYGHKYV